MGIFFADLKSSVHRISTCIQVWSMILSGRFPKLKKKEVCSVLPRVSGAFLFHCILFPTYFIFSHFHFPVLYYHGIHYFDFHFETFLFFSLLHSMRSIYLILFYFPFHMFHFFHHHLSATKYSSSNICSITIIISSKTGSPYIFSAANSNITITMIIHFCLQIVTGNSNTQNYIFQGICMVFPLRHGTCT